MKRKLLIKNRRLFIFWKTNWLNVSLQIESHGGGLRGFKKLLRGLNKCRRGEHTYGGVFRMKTMTTSRECFYCKKANVDENS